MDRRTLTFNLIKDSLHLEDEKLGALVREYIARYDEETKQKKQDGYDKAMNKLNPISVVIEGVSYPSINKAMSETGYNRNKIKKLSEENNEI